MDDYVTKPLSIALLLQAIERYYPNRASVADSVHSARFPSLKGSVG